MRVLRTLSPAELSALSPLFGTPVAGGFVRLKNASRQVINPTTGELVSRRQYDETYGTAIGTTFERKAKTRQDQGIGKPITRLVKRRTYERMGREHNEFKFTYYPNDENPLARDFIPRLASLRTRFGSRGNPTVYIEITATLSAESEGGTTKEFQTRSIGAFNDAAQSILIYDVAQRLKEYHVKKITKSLMVWVRNARK